MTESKRAMMDTNFWIQLKQDEEYRARFFGILENSELEILFSYGNFIDLLKAPQQDELSKIIAESVDIYIPNQPYSGTEYAYYSSPDALIPDQTERIAFRRDLGFLDDDLALEYLFRTYTWDTPEKFLEMTESVREVREQYGHENTMGYMFKDELETEDDKYILRQEDNDPISFIRGMLELHRISQLKAEESLDPNDYADMEICAHALITDCDYLFIEAKWINTDVIDNVLSELTLDPVVTGDYEEFLALLES